MNKIIYFTAKWCGPCKMMGPVVDQLRSHGVQIEVIDIDDNQGLVQQYGVRNVPTFLFMKDDRIVDKHIGAAPFSLLDGKVKRNGL